MATELTWLGHSAFRVDTPGGKRIYVDPFSRATRGRPTRSARPNAATSSSSHTGTATTRRDVAAIHNRFECAVVAQVELRQWLTAQGVADDGGSHSINKGGTISVEGVRVTLTHAQHSSSAPDGTYTGESCGIVLELEDGFKLYFAGDTNVFGDMSLIGRIYSPDVAILPIGDHFTMGPREAAVAIELLGVIRCVPCHYGTFGLLTGTPDELREARARRRGDPGARARGDADLLMRERWFGSTGRKVPSDRLRGRDGPRGCARARRPLRPRAHSRGALEGTPVVVRATTSEEVVNALSRGEVACVLVRDEALLALDLAELTYG